MGLFAQGLSSRFGFEVPLLDEALPLPFSATPWRVEWLLSGVTRSPETEPLFSLQWFEPGLQKANLLAIDPKVLVQTCLVNLTWPSLEIASDWIFVLQQCQLVLDPDPDRVALLHQFGVNVRLSMYPAIQENKLPDVALTRAQLRLGLPDPSWLLPCSLALCPLAILGSSGVASEQRWANFLWSHPHLNFLWIPRINQLILGNMEDAIALQAWLNRLSQSCCTILQLEAISEGICAAPAKPARLLGPTSESLCLEYWEASL